jgi:hypothetical protein
MPSAKAISVTLGAAQMIRFVFLVALAASEDDFCFF